MKTIRILTRMFILPLCSSGNSQRADSCSRFSSSSSWKKHSQCRVWCCRVTVICDVPTPMQLDLSQGSLGKRCGPLKPFPFGLRKEKGGGEGWGERLLVRDFLNQKTLLNMLYMLGKLQHLHCKEISIVTMFFCVCVQNKSRLLAQNNDRLPHKQEGCKLKKIAFILYIPGRPWPKSPSWIRGHRLQISRITVWLLAPRHFVENFHLQERGL